IEYRTDEFGAGFFCERAKRLVSERYPLLRIAQHDKIALRLEKTAGPFFGFFQFPVAISQRFIAQGHLVHFPAGKVQLKTQRGESQACHRKEKTNAKSQHKRLVARHSGQQSSRKTIDDNKECQEYCERAQR